MWLHFCGVSSWDQRLREDISQTFDGASPCLSHLRCGHKNPPLLSLLHLAACCGRCARCAAGTAVSCTGALQPPTCVLS